MDISRRSLVHGAAVATAASLAGPSARASPVEDFFRGKTIRLLIGTTPGAGYDLIARLLAQHIGRMIPGNPSLVVENMPGAGSLTMMNYLYNRAPRDGTVFGLPLNGVLLEPTLKLMSRTGGAANFDIDKMPWIGSTTEDAQVLWFRSDSKIKTVEDLRSIKSIAGASVGAWGIGTYRRNDEVDVRYTRDGRTLVAQGLPVTPPADQTDTDRSHPS